jgi:hypothetical protein
MTFPFLSVICPNNTLTRVRAYWRNPQFFIYRIAAAPYPGLALRGLMLIPQGIRLCVCIFARERSMPSRQHAGTPKLGTILSLSADVLDAARSLHLNVSQICYSHLREVVRREQEPALAH